MKYLRFSVDEEVKYGVLEGETITELEGNFLYGNVKKLDQTYIYSEVKRLPPVAPGQVIGIGLNYAEHAKEWGGPIPEEPMMFMASPTAVTADGETITLPSLERRIDHEAELAVVIGKQAKDVTETEALDYVFGYTCGNDLSDRDLQNKDGQFTRAKSYATFKPLGPVIETELDPNQAAISCTLNGEVKQQSNTSDLIHNVQRLIAHITEVMTLNPGDVILTGTPSGVGPLRPGDEVVVEVEGIGKLTNQVTHQA